MDNTGYIEAVIDVPDIRTTCIVCGDAINLGKPGSCSDIMRARICAACRNAIMEMRRTVENIDQK